MSGSEVASRVTSSSLTFSSLLPSSGRSAASTRRATGGRTPSTSIVRTANTDVSRAPTYASNASTASARLSTTERLDGIRSTARARGGSRATAARAWDSRGRRLTQPLSPPRKPLLRRRGELRQAQEPDLVLELDAELRE